MKLLADENIEHALVNSLRNAGYDVVAVREMLPGAEDTVVLELAFHEHRILLTNDSDFGFMVVQQRAPSYGVILLRCTSEDIQQKISAVQHLCKHHPEKLPHHFTVVTERHIRIRPLDHR